MTNAALFIVYCVINIFCLGLVLGILKFLYGGLKIFFQETFRNDAIASLFIRMTSITLILGGTGAAIGSTYGEGAGKNWLTLTWSAAGQIKESISRLTILFAVLLTAYLLFYVLNKRTERD